MKMKMTRMELSSLILLKSNELETEIISSLMNFIEVNLFEISIIIKNTPKYERCYALTPYERCYALTVVNTLEQYMSDNKYNSIIERLNYKDEELERLEGIKFIVDDLQYIKFTLQDINTHKGYVASTNIFDSTEYPIISDVANALLKFKDFVYLNNYEQAKVYKWIVNILLINYYTICNKLLKILENLLENLLENNGFLDRIQVLELNDLISRLGILKL
ncbi:hypothetical protein L873DRAFT_1918471 [Choiromyces venosus 120613-1]|uniref:Uncharacterized protein n=1 Tax=Choiromyces venosus 120613-1 TaxID=1336337 RepID=A0A3N4IT31_9PEZI|nr:hypothetical protein L873DRAFT_1918471 [Choiromyces venosus 120613-1]